MANLPHLAFKMAQQSKVFFFIFSPLLIMFNKNSVCCFQRALGLFNIGGHGQGFRGNPIVINHQVSDLSAHRLGRI